jgi:hypothetical protein
LAVADTEALGAVVVVVVESAKATAGAATPIEATIATAAMDLMLSSFMFGSPFKNKYDVTEGNCEIDVRELSDH